MGPHNSSLTRVKPVFNELMKQPPSVWLPELWRMAVATREGAAAEDPAPVAGELRGATFERPLPPSTAFLRWMVQHTDLLTPLPPPNYGATGEEAKKKRGWLFGSDPELRRAAVQEALDAIEKRGGRGSGQQWWAFEGFTHVDACFETQDLLLLVEGKRTETVSPSTRWFKHRNQLWRNIEVAGELADNRPFGVMLAVERREDGRKALDQAAASREGSYPHLTAERRELLDRHFLGFVVWSEVVSRFKLPSSVLLDRTV